MKNRDRDIGINNEEIERMRELFITDQEEGRLIKLKELAERLRDSQNEEPGETAPQK